MASDIPCFNPRHFLCRYFFFFFFKFIFFSLSFLNNEQTLLNRGILGHLFLCRYQHFISGKIINYLKVILLISYEDIHSS